MTLVLTLQVVKQRYRMESNLLKAPELETAEVR